MGIEPTSEAWEALNKTLKAIDLAAFSFSQDDLSWKLDGNCDRFFRAKGRQPIGPEVRNLIRQMSLANPRWDAPRIHGELLKIGIELSQATGAKNMVRHRKRPSQTWRTFLESHVKELASADFFVVPPVCFKILFVIVILEPDRRWPIHVAVTEYPTAEWVAQQVLEVFPWDSAPRYLVRDRDGSYRERFREAAQ